MTLKISVVAALLMVTVLTLTAPLLSAPAQACSTNRCVDSPPPAKPKGD